MPLVKASESSLPREYVNSNYSFLPPTQNVMAHSSFSIKMWPWNSLCEEAWWGLFVSGWRQNKAGVYCTFHWEHVSDALCLHLPVDLKKIDFSLYAQVNKWREKHNIEFTAFHFVYIQYVHTQSEGWVSICFVPETTRQLRAEVEM